MFFHPDKNSFQRLPWRDKDGINSARLICDIYNADGTPFEGCPRCNLKRVMKEAEKMGFSMNIGPEAEFFLFAKDKDGNITTTTQDRAGYYDVGPEDLGEDVRLTFVLTLQEMGFDIELHTTKFADGQHEVDFRYMIF
jgi:glutamine synthetase